jgi:hypothetical protein
LTTFSVPIFGAVFEVHFGVHFGLFLDSDLLVLRDFFDFEGCSGPVFGPLLDRSFHHDFHHFWTRLVSLPQFTPSVDTLPIRTLNCTPASI